MVPEVGFEPATSRGSGYKFSPDTYVGTSTNMSLGNVEIALSSFEYSTLSFS